MAFKLFHRVQAGRKALVTSLFSRREREVTGPCLVPVWKSMRPMKFHVLADGEQASVVHANGTVEIIHGPRAVDVHPDAAFEVCRKEFLAENEALVLIAKDGTQRYIFGKLPEGKADGPCEQRSVVFVGPGERLHEFVLSGGGNEDGLSKKPGALRFHKLRLKPSQAYFTVPVRTREDHTPLFLKLMIYLQICDLPRFTNSSDDPFGAMFNSILTELVELVSSKSFDEFKTEPKKLIQEHFSSDKLKSFETYGVRVDRITLRGWEPQNQQVQAVLNEAALANTRREIQAAEHRRELEAITQERERLEQSEKVQTLRETASSNEGRAEGKRLTAVVAAMREELKQENGGALVSAVIPLLVAAKAIGNGHLALPPELLTAR